MEPLIGPVGTTWAFTVIAIAVMIIRLTTSTAGPIVFIFFGMIDPEPGHDVSSVIGPGDETFTINLVRIADAFVGPVEVITIVWARLEAIEALDELLGLWNGEE